MNDVKKPSQKELARLLKLKATEPAEAPRPEHVVRMHGLEIKAGKGEAPPDSDFVRGQKKKVMREGTEPFSEKHPAWVRALAEKKVGDEELLDAARKHVSRAPSRPNLLVAQAILNDVGRKPGGGERMRKMITQDLVDQLIEQGKES